MHTQRYGFWGYLILIIGLAGICALLIIINQDVLIKSGVSARLIWGIWAGLFSLFYLGLCVRRSGGSGSKGKRNLFTDQKFGRKRPTRIFSIRGYFNRSQLKYSVTLWSVLAA